MKMKSSFSVALNESCIKKWMEVFSREKKIFKAKKQNKERSEFNFVMCETSENYTFPK